MNKENIHQIISEAKALATTDELKSLISDLEEFIEIQETTEGGHLSQDWQDARKKLWSSFEKVTALYGISPEMIQQSIENFPDLTQGNGTLSPRNPKTAAQAAKMRG